MCASQARGSRLVIFRGGGGWGSTAPCVDPANFRLTHGPNPPTNGPKSPRATYVRATDACELLRVRASIGWLPGKARHPIEFFSLQPARAKCAPAPGIDLMLRRLSPSNDDARTQRRTTTTRTPFILPSLIPFVPHPSKPASTGRAQSESGQTARPRPRSTPGRRRQQQRGTGIFIIFVVLLLLALALPLPSTMAAPSGAAAAAAADSTGNPFKGVCWG